MGAFQAGSGMGEGELYLLIAGVGLAGILIAAGWIFVSAYRGYARGRVDGDILAVVSVKALVLILLFFWLLL
ncbi:DUF3262 family protein [Pistricoccus aurantiacus]|uniref:DUF3262 family protein n=1 Tax=Pistricoccus aurantiacus TaxID=1883414 RepID=A0A5B8SRQ9_9GAMM|nr:DUF3262 family protein [Pistricoccus aurantiacus]QEA38637.1 DUF3262 family protein [Pistricoccus aurantiacus]